MKTERKYDGENYTEISNTHQNSIELGKTSKGTWYVKSVKVYAEEDDIEAIMKKYTTVANEEVRSLDNEKEEE